MPKFTVETKYLSHTDISDVSDTIVTIKDFQQETLGMGAQAQEKWVLYFRENKKGLVLNKTNGKILVKMLGEEMDEWIGQKIALYVKDDVEYQGDIVSAIRIRLTKPKGKEKTTNPAVHAMDLDAQITACRTVKGCLDILREVSTVEGLSEEDRDALTESINQKMGELKAVK